MDNPLVTVLVISVIGMSLLFLSLVLFYGIISLLTAVTRDRSSIPSASTDSVEVQKDVPTDRVLRAALVAIALARAEAQKAGKARGSVSLASGDCDVTPWWSLHHQQRLTGKGEPRRP